MPSFDSYSEAASRPRLVRLRPNLTVAAFECMKLLPARFILTEAIRQGHLVPGGEVAETTSGTFGKGLAHVCAEIGLRLTLVTDPATDPALKRQLEGMGAKVIVVDRPSAQGGYQAARLEILNDILSRTGAFWPSQYTNPGNPDAYAELAEAIIEDVPEMNTLVGPVGSGGSTGGTSQYLRLAGHELAVVAVDTPNSVLFGQPDGPRLLRGLGNSMPMPNLCHTVYDSVHWVPAAEAYSETRDLLARHGLFVGPTTGAAMVAARYVAESDPDAKVVLISPDSGHRYTDTVFDDAWVAKTGVTLGPRPDAPRFVDHPLDAGPDWSALRWRRRTLEAVMGGGR